MNKWARKKESEVTQLCLTLCDPMDCSLPRSSIHFPDKSTGDFPGKSTGVGCHFLLQRIFPTQGSNLGLPHCRQTLYHLSHQGSQLKKKKGGQEWVKIYNIWGEEMKRSEKCHLAIEWWKEKEKSRGKYLGSWKTKWNQEIRGLRTFLPLSKPTNQPKTPLIYWIIMYWQKRGPSG